MFIVVTKGDREDKKQTGYVQTVAAFLQLSDLQLWLMFKIVLFSFQKLVTIFILHLCVTRTICLSLGTVYMVFLILEYNII